MRVRVTVYNCHIHNTAQNSSDNFPSYPPDNHHSSDDVYWMGAGGNCVEGVRTHNVEENELLQREYVPMT